MKNSKKSKSVITSIQYVHDPEAAKEWMELFMEITKKQYLDRYMNKDNNNKQVLDH